MIKILELDDQLANELSVLSQEFKKTPVEVIQDAILVYRRQCANERYLGKGLLDLQDDHPGETKQDLKAILKKKYGYIG